MLSCTTGLTGLLKAGQLLPKGALAALISTTSEVSQAQAAAATQSAKPALVKQFEIYRWNPDSPDKPKYQSYKVDINRYVQARFQSGMPWLTPCVTSLCATCSCGPMMLDVLFKIKDEQDGTLAFRRSCRWAQ